MLVKRINERKMKILLYISGVVLGFILLVFSIIGYFYKVRLDFVVIVSVASIISISSFTLKILLFLISNRWALVLRKANEIIVMLFLLFVFVFLIVISGVPFVVKSSAILGAVVVPYYIFKATKDLMGCCRKLSTSDRAK